MAERITSTSEQDELAIAWAESQGSTFECSVRALLDGWVQGMLAVQKAHATDIALSALGGTMTAADKALAQATLDAAVVVEPTTDAPPA
ncbi:MAG: hypothetical protein ABIJ57_07575 [Pseudomonadota bacterium]